MDFALGESSVTENAGIKSSIKPPPPPAALEVDNRNYDKLVKSGKDVLIAFTAPWVSLVCFEICNCRIRC
jgi:hypothetical protein